MFSLIVSICFNLVILFIFFKRFTRYYLGIFVFLVIFCMSNFYFKSEAIKRIILYTKFLFGNGKHTAERYVINDDDKRTILSGLNTKKEKELFKKFINCQSNEDLEIEFNNLNRLELRRILRKKALAIFLSHKFMGKMSKEVLRIENVYLELLAGYGMVGLGLFIFPITYTLFIAKKLFHKLPKSTQFEILQLLSVLFIFAFCGFFSGSVRSFYFFYFLLCIVLSMLCKNEKLNVRGT